MTLEVLDADGKSIARMSSKEEPEEPGEEGDYSEREPKHKPLPIEPGLHRVAWNLQRDGAEVIRKAKLDSGDPKDGPLVRPGTYTLKLTVEGKSYTTQVVVKPDPRQVPRPENKAAVQPLDEAALAKQEEVALKVRDDITRLTRIVEQLRAVKQQLAARNTLLDEEEKTAPLIKGSRELITKLDALEEKLHNPRARVVYDILAQKGGAQLYSQLAFLFETLKEGDGAPTQGVKEVYEQQSLLLKKYELEWKVLLADDLMKLNELAKKLDIPGVIVPPLERKKVTKEEK
jgi:hypothetical protein